VSSVQPHVAEKSAAYEVLEHLKNSEGWQSATIESLISNGGIFVDGDWVESKDQDPNGDVRLIQLADVGDGAFRDRSERFLTSEKARELSCTFLASNDLLVARMPDPLGRACIFPGDKKPSVTVVDVAVVRPRNSEVNTRWLMYRINSPQFRRAVASMQSGSTRQRISRKNLAKITFLLPPRRIQDDLVAEIEKQFSRLDEAVANLKRVKANFRRYRASVLLELSQFDGKSLPAGWCLRTLPELGELERGKSKHRPRDDPKLYGGPYPFIQTGDIRQSGGRIRRYSQTYSNAGLAQSRLWPKGTLCITIAANIAETGILEFDACFPDSVVGFRTDGKLVTVRYVELYFRAIKEQLARNASATAQKNINLEVLSKIAIPVPSMAEQRTIVESIDQKFSIVEELEAQVKADLARADRLRQATLARAFRSAR